jgi:undecaprenyl-diphosphatase
MIDFLQLDRAVFTWINITCSNSVFDVIMPWITSLGDATTVWLWLVLIGLLMIRHYYRSIGTGRDEGKRYTILKAFFFPCLYMVLIFGVNAGVYKGLKHLCQRPRPFLEQTVTLRVDSTSASFLRNSGSFPSGHACNAFMVATLFAGWFQRKRFGLYGLAALVALSRIYLGIHYPGDVLAGGCLGFAITWLMLFFHPLRNKIPA